MKQIEIFQINSPCIGVCQSGTKGFCMGCFRSREERLHWTKLDQDIQSQIIKACGIRKKRAERGKWAKKAVSGDDAQIDLLAQHKP